jgi:uncharacterized protein YciI
VPDAARAATRLDTMDFLIHSHAAPGAAEREDDPALDEQHWSYMDRFAGGMIARGPTLGPDRATWTGSLHIVDLPSAHAAERFLEEEPYNRAGAYERHLVRRFENLLGRTMWEAPGLTNEPRYFVMAAQGDAHGLPPERMIVLGRLLTSGDGEPAGFAAALQAPTREAVRGLLADHGLDECADVEVLDWEFGGRR